MSDSIKVFFVSVFVLLAVIAGLFSLMFGIPAYNRHQAILNASNRVQVTEIEINNQNQLVEVEKKRAEIRVQEAKGIAESQRIIDSSLTHNYLQYLAIQSQKEMAGSPNHTTVYIPSGENGIPIVRTVNEDRGEQGKKK